MYEKSEYEQDDDETEESTPPPTATNTHQKNNSTPLKTPVRKSINASKHIIENNKLSDYYADKLETDDTHSRSSSHDVPFSTPIVEKSITKRTSIFGTSTPITTAPVTPSTGFSFSNLMGRNKPSETPQVSATDLDSAVLKRGESSYFKEMLGSFATECPNSPIPANETPCM